MKTNSAGKLTRRIVFPLAQTKRIHLDAKTALRQGKGVNVSLKPEIVKNALKDHKREQNYENLCEQYIEQYRHKTKFKLHLTIEMSRGFGVVN